jgi:hypothetical protein
MEQRRIKDILYIRMKENCNLDAEITLCPLWDPLVR